MDFRARNEIAEKNDIMILTFSEYLTFDLQSNKLTHIGESHNT